MSRRLTADALKAGMSAGIVREDAAIAERFARAEILTNLMAAKTATTAAAEVSNDAARVPAVSPTAPAPAAQRAPAPKGSPTTDSEVRYTRAPGRRRSGCTQLTILVPDELRKRARILALKEGTDLSAVVADLLDGWAKARGPV